MNRRSVWLIGAGGLVVFAMLFAFSIDRVTITASENALKDQGWRASFSTPLKEEAVSQKRLYLVDKDGEKLSIDMQLSSDRRSVQVDGLEPGTYTLHVERDAIDGEHFKTYTTQNVTFTIHETIESVSSEKELVAYFERAQKMQENQVYFAGEEMEVMEDSAASGESNKSSGGDHSTTNNQVEGVDEADSVKTDGKYVYSVLTNRKVEIIDIQDATNPVVASEIAFTEDFYSTQLFLHEQMLVVLGEKYYMENELQPASDSMYRMPMNGMTMVRIYDVSNPENPTLIREVGAEGSLSGARKVENYLYFVTNVRKYVDFTQDVDGEMVRPFIYDSEKEEELSILPYPDISILPGALDSTYAIITAIDLTSDAKKDVATKGYLGGSEQMYMSENNLYVTAMLYEANPEAQNKDAATSRMMWWPMSGNTEVFKFAINGTNVTFHNSALLKGSLLNQFSMDEYKGNFRAVTTEGNMWDEKNPSKNHLFILDENMKQTGSVEGLAKGERIYSARFMGDKAYMVTFRETDPLFVIDVANPSEPKVLGELKIPGFSNYLHPLDENHLIGFGYETVAEKDPNGGEPRILTLGMKISLFDVSDFANPKEKDTEIIGGRGTYSPIQYDHKALFQHKAKSLYGFPVVIYDEGTRKDYIDYQRSGALIYEITANEGIQLKGNLLNEKKAGQPYEDWEKEIQRMLYSGDTLYTVSMKELKGYSLETFDKISELQFN
ncbi:beta-propeller domain-containing protein [Sporosarcina sp. CAU 1771]